MLTAKRSYDTDALLKSGRFTDAEVETMVNVAFGNAGAIVKEAVAEAKVWSKARRLKQHLTVAIDLKYFIITI